VPNHRSAARRIGLLLIAVGTAALAFVGYQLAGTGLYAARAQAALRHGLSRAWSSPPPAATPGASVPRWATPTLGDAVAILRVPRFGRSYAEVIVEGVTLADLRRGPGHYPGSALPGQVGNFAVAGHRTTWGAPFGRLGELRPGDAIVVETAREWLTYTVTGSRIVAPTAVTVTASVPGAPGQRASAALLTFTTCNPRFSDRQRLVVFGRLTARLSRSAGWPPSLAA